MGIFQDGMCPTTDMEGMFLQDDFWKVRDAHGESIRLFQGDIACDTSNVLYAFDV